MEKDGITVIEIWSSSDEEAVEERRTRNSSVFYFPKGKGSVTIKDEFKNKKKKKIKPFDEDCFILDYDPFDSLKKLSINDKENNDADDLSVIAERGQVACRDFPHSRHLCVKFPFSQTPHHSHCEQCYCYVCDSIAPCKFWSDGPQEHCHATADDLKWKVLRKAGMLISSTQGNPLDQRGMDIGTAERHGSYLSNQNISVNQPMLLRDRFDYDGQRDNPSSQDMGSCGEGIDRFTCFTCGRRDYCPQECPSTAAAAGRLSSIPRFNGGLAGNCNEELYIHDRYINHPYAGDFSPPVWDQRGGGHTYGNYDDRFAGDFSPQVWDQRGGGHMYGNYDDRYAGDRSSPVWGQHRGGHTYGNYDDRYAGDKCPPAGPSGGGYTYGIHDRRNPPARGQFGGGSRYSPAEGGFEGGDRYGGGAWDHHHNGYTNDMDYDCDKEGGNRYGGGAWDHNHHNGYRNDMDYDYDREGGQRGAGNIWKERQRGASSKWEGGQRGAGSKWKGEHRGAGSKWKGEHRGSGNMWK